MTQRHLGEIETLFESLTAYVDEMRELERSPRTIKNNRVVVDGFLKTVDPTLRMQTRKLGEAHVRKWLRGLRVEPSSKRAYLGYVQRFMTWCVKTNRLRANTADRLAVGGRESERSHVRLPADRFPDLLDAAEAKHPRNRIAVAVGLYTLLRAVDVVALRIGDVDRAAGTIRLYQSKVKRWHEIGISADLDEELERWYRWYRADLGVTKLEDHWPVLPPLHRPGNNVTPVDTLPFRILQYRRNGTLATLNTQTYTQCIVQPALVAVDVPMRFIARNGESKPANEGAHTLRRSGARALYDMLIAEGKDRTDALFLVQALLDHSSVTVTARYVGVSLQKDKVNKILRGARMYGPTTRDTENVISLRARAAR